MSDTIKNGENPLDELEDLSDLELEYMSQALFEEAMNDDEEVEDSETALFSRQLEELLSDITYRQIGFECVKCNTIFIKRFNDRTDSMHNKIAKCCCGAALLYGNAKNYTLLNNCVSKCVRDLAEVVPPDLLPPALIK